MKNPSVKFGILAGIAMALYLLAFWGVSHPLVLKPAVYWSALLLPMIGMVVATRRELDRRDEALTRRDAVKTAFLAWVLAMVVFHAFLYLLFNFIDPTLPDLQRQAMEAATGEDLKSQDLTMTLGSVVFRCAFMLIPGFLLSLAASSFFKK